MFVAVISKVVPTAVKIITLEFKLSCTSVGSTFTIWGTVDLPVERVKVTPSAVVTLKRILASTLFKGTFTGLVVLAVKSAVVVRSSGIRGPSR